MSKYENVIAVLEVQIDTLTSNLEFDLDASAEQTELRLATKLECKAVIELLKGQA